MSRRAAIDPPAAGSAESREAWGGFVADVGRVLQGSGGGSQGSLALKIAATRMAWRLVRRYPMPALCVAGAALLIYAYAGRGHAYRRQSLPR
jgi:hypothetical protein